MPLASSRRAGSTGAAVVVCLSLTLASSRAAAETSVCVEVHKKSWTTEPKPKGSTPEAWRYAADPTKTAEGFDPAAYLRRLLEYEVTHEPGFHSLPKGCQHRVQVELFPLTSGWTVFARFTGTAREEKVDHAQLDEFPQLAQRLAFALLRDRPIQETITRENVLRTDSEHAFRTIATRGHLALALGTSLRIGKLATANEADAPATEELRWLTPVSFQVGYRGKFKEWGLDALGRLSLGSSERAVRNNRLGGHVDYTGSASLGLHFLRYLDPPGMTSFYYGGGASFELSHFTIVRPETERENDDRDGVIGAGLSVDLLVGYEFLRASSLHFFAQAELQIPTYAVRAESAYGSLDAYLPGGLAQIGVLF